MKKKLIAFLLALVLCAGVFAGKVFANEASARILWKNGAGRLLTKTED